MGYAGGKESAGRLDRQSQISLDNPEEAVHGISVPAQPPIEGRPGSAIPRSAVEEKFPVIDTPFADDPLHRTVILPDPVTSEVVKMWNAL